MAKEYNFSLFNNNYDDFTELKTQLASFKEKGITEFVLHDKNVLSNKKSLLSFIQIAAELAPDTFYSFNLEAKMLDGDVISALEQLYCSINIEMSCTMKVEPSKSVPFLMLDKKLYSKKAALLNADGLIFGFNIGLARQSGDSFKAFSSRLDFAAGLYPNHINIDYEPMPKPTATFSSKELKEAADISFACHTFYNAGRAVPWFLAILQALKITPCSFFSDFAEWQRCNNCSSNCFNPDESSHLEIEKMQLCFLELKFEERRLQRLFNAVSDIVRLNGAFSRAFAEEEETELDLSYSPADIFSPGAMNLFDFSENVCMEQGRYRIYWGRDDVEYSLIQ